MSPSTGPRPALRRVDWALIVIEAALFVGALALMLAGYQRATALVSVACLLNLVLVYRVWRRRVDAGEWPKRSFGDGPPRSSNPQ